MRSTAALILAAVISAGAPVLGAHAADRALAAGLVRNAWYWQARGREDKAEEAWKRVLAADPDDPEALAAVAGGAARDGRIHEAQATLARLEKLNPGHPALAPLRRQIELGLRYRGLLGEARALVHGNKLEQGAAKYRELFGAAGPPGDLALEYYQTVEGMPGGWEEARDGLRLLVRRAREEPRYRLALAEVLTYRDDTRREGIRSLEALARDAAVGKDATAAWRRALLWLAPAPTDIPLFQSYLRAHRDPEVARRVDRARHAGTLKEAYAALDRGDAREAERLFRSAGDDPEARRGLALVAERAASNARKAGFGALERGDLRAAEKSFRDAGGDDPDARLGLALVAQRDAAAAMRDQDFGRARDLLERARRLAPQRADLWEAPLRDAQFWLLVADARRARAAGRDGEAEAKLLRAVNEGPPAERWHADAALGDLYLARGARADAEARFRRALSAAPDDPASLRALASLLADGGRFDEAIALNDRLARVAPGQTLRGGWLRAEAHRARAAQARAAHDLAKARDELVAARRDDASDVWVLHDLANVLLEQGAIVEAQPVVDALVRAAPALPAARLAQARLLAAEGQHAQALEALSAVPAGADRGVAELRRALEVKVRVPALLALAADGRRAAAVSGLASLEAQVADAPELASTVAVAWSRLGEHRRALALLRSAVARAPAATRGARLEIASALLAAGDDAAAQGLLAGLEREPGLSPDERRALADLRVATAIRIADRQRERGDGAAAAAALDPVLRDYPADPRALCALGRLLESEGNARRAHAVYRRVLAAAPADLDALRGGVDTALALGDLDEARTLADEAVRRHPQDPGAHLLAGRVARRSGDDAEAMRSLQAALVRVERAPLEPGAASPAAVAFAASSSSAPVPEASPQRSSAPPADAATAPALRADIEREMDQVRDRHRPALGGTFEARQRDGEPGLSRLTELRQGIDSEIPLGLEGRALFHFAEVELDSGRLALGAAPRVGTGGPAEGAFRTSGTELRGGYEGRHLIADIGMTPLGFPVQSLVGGVRLRQALGPFQLSIEGARRNVTDSVLSYAGVKDPASGRYWGGVVTEGGGGELGFSAGPVSLRAYGSYDRVVGFRVAENQRVGAGAGADVRVYRGAIGELGVGLSGAAFGYQKNLRYFTFGHGGYFSPERFVHAGVPVRFRHDGRLRFEIVAEPALHTYTEAAAPTFALPPPPGAPGGGAGYAGQTSRGFAFDGHALLGVTLGRAFDASVRVAAQEAPEFRELKGGIVLRYLAGH